MQQAQPKTSKQTNKTENNMYQRGCREIKTLEHCLWEYKRVQLLQKAVQWFLKKLQTELLYDPAIPLLGIYPKEVKAESQRDSCAQMHKTTVRNSQEVEATHTSTDG